MRRTSAGRSATGAPLTSPVCRTLRTWTSDDSTDSRGPTAGEAAAACATINHAAEIASPILILIIVLLRCHAVPIAVRSSAYYPQSACQRQAAASFQTVQPLRGRGEG